MAPDTQLILFQEKHIRRVWHEERWHFAVVDVIEALSGSPKPRQYWTKIKKKLAEESQLYPNWLQLKIEAADGKKYLTEVADSEQLFRIIMAVPSPRAEPFKLWLARVGKERMDEIDNPELAAERARTLYKAKGYPDDWIDARLRSIETRQQLTDEWKGRGVQEGIEYSILTAEISRATFGMAPKEYRDFKGLRRENLRDHMTDIELIFTMLGEAQTKIEAREMDAQGFIENREAAILGGTAAGGALETFEQRTGRKVSTPDNFLKRLDAGDAE